MLDLKKNIHYNRIEIFIIQQIIVFEKILRILNDFCGVINNKPSKTVEHTSGNLCRCFITSGRIKPTWLPATKKGLHVP